MYIDTMNHTNNGLECAIVEGTVKRQKPLVHATYIITACAFQIAGVNVMETKVINYDYQ